MAAYAAGGAVTISSISQRKTGLATVNTILSASKSFISNHDLSQNHLRAPMVRWPTIRASANSVVASNHSVPASLDLPLSSLTAISPLDGRYGGQLKGLRGYFSEWALMRYRVLVEVHFIGTS